jgi:hypothetical protein
LSTRRHGAVRVGRRDITGRHHRPRDAHP